MICHSILQTVPLREAQQSTKKKYKYNCSEFDEAEQKLSDNN